MLDEYTGSMGKQYHAANTVLKLGLQVYLAWPRKYYENQERNPPLCFGSGLPQLNIYPVKIHAANG